MDIMTSNTLQKPKKGKSMLVVISLAIGALFMYADRTVLYPMLEVIAAEFKLGVRLVITSTIFLLFMQVPMDF